MVTFSAEEQRVVLIVLALALAVSGAQIFSKSSGIHRRAANHAHPAPQDDSSDRPPRPDEAR